MAVEDEFGVEIDEAAVPALKTFGDFVDYIAELLMIGGDSVDIDDVFAFEKRSILEKLRELTQYEHLTSEIGLLQLFPKRKDRLAFWQSFGQTFSLKSLPVNMSRRAYHCGLVAGAIFFTFGLFGFIEFIERTSWGPIGIVYAFIWVIGSVLVGNWTSWLFRDIPSRFKTIGDVMTMILWRHYLLLRKELSDDASVKTIRCPFDRHELEKRLKDLVVEHSGRSYMDISRKMKLVDLF